MAIPALVRISIRASYAGLISDRPLLDGTASFPSCGLLLAGWGPEMTLQVDAALDDRNAFAFEKFFLKRGVRFADEDFAVCAKDAMPGDSPSPWSCCHSMAGSTCAPWETQRSG
jgi:hypothetical protein